MSGFGGEAKGFGCWVARFKSRSVRWGRLVMSLRGVGDGYDFYSLLHELRLYLVGQTVIFCLVGVQDGAPAKNLM